MTEIELETEIAAPVERCFLLSLSIDLHKASTAGTSEEAIAGVTSGLIGAGERVTWRGRHFGFMLTHESLISAYEPPFHFRDTMVRGMFKSFEHDHFFENFDAASGKHTLMRDVLRFSAPLGILGRFAENAVLRSYFKRFLLERNAVIQTVAEGPSSAWLPYISAARQPDPLE